MQGAREWKNKHLGKETFLDHNILFYKQNRVMVGCYTEWNGFVPIEVRNIWVMSLFNETSAIGDLCLCKSPLWHTLFKCFAVVKFRVLVIQQLQKWNIKKRVFIPVRFGTHRSKLISVRYIQGTRQFKPDNLRLSSKALDWAPNNSCCKPLWPEE